MKILVDMNLSPRWPRYFQESGHAAKHWSEIGSPDAADEKIMEWAASNGYSILTHDLDYGILLHASGDTSPSVIQIRTIDVDPNILAPLVMQVLNDAKSEIENGAIVTVYSGRHRISILPLRG